MDTISKSQRSYNMSRIKAKNTKPEIIVRKKLFNSGLRYRLHSSKLPGKPDILINKYSLIIDIRGCFWHGHENCKYSSTPKSNSSYWTKKIIRNKKRDIEHFRSLEERGYTIFVIWECEIRKEESLNLKVEEIKSFISQRKDKEKEKKYKN